MSDRNPARRATGTALRITAAGWACLFLLAPLWPAHAEGWEDQPFADSWRRRDARARPRRIVAALQLAEDAVVADLGAGKGYYTRYLAEAVPRGRVLALDVDATALALNREIMRAAGLENVEPALVPQDDPGLERGEADLVFISSTWHFFSDRLRYASLLSAALLPGQRLAVIGTGKVAETRAGRQPRGRTDKFEVWREAEAGGLKLTHDHDFIEHRFFLMFEAGTGPIHDIDGFRYVTSELAIGGLPDPHGLELLEERGFMALVDGRATVTPALADQVAAQGLQLERLDLERLCRASLEALLETLSDPATGIVYITGDSPEQLSALLYGLWNAERVELTDFELSLLTATVDLDRPLITTVESAFEPSGAR